MSTLAVAPRRRRRGTPAVCGTPADYQRHRRAGENACTPCLDSVNESRMAVDRIQVEEHLAELMVARPDLSTCAVFGAAHHAGLVMGA